MINVYDVIRDSLPPSFPSIKIANILQAALDAADPALVVQKNLEWRENEIRVGTETYSLYPDSRIVVVAIGKASMSMAEAANRQLSGRVHRGIVVCKHNPSSIESFNKIIVHLGSHPVPDEKSMTGALKIKQTLEGLTEKDLALLLISGGGSSLVCLPAPGVNLQDIQSVTTSLLKSGASINEMNAVRKHLDLIKGGGLLKMANPARVAALVISDVVNSPLDVIASGPAVPDPSTFDDARSILDRFIGIDSVPRAVAIRMEKGCAGEIEETLKPADPDSERAVHTIVASNQISAQAAHAAAISEGFTSEIITCELTTEARLAGEYLADYANKKDSNVSAWLGIAGGETTVKVTGDGLGGRNLEVALGAVRKLSGIKNTLLVTLATDGEDGPTNAAGAFVTGNTLSTGLRIGIEPETFLANNDAYHYFEKTGGLILTGPSGTNVNDLNFIFKF